MQWGKGKGTQVGLFCSSDFSNSRSIRERMLAASENYCKDSVDTEPGTEQTANANTGHPVRLHLCLTPGTENSATHPGVLT